jgi:adenylate cyclase
MVLMAYVTGHLTTLAFGLVSLDLLDRIRIPMMAPWQTGPGYVLLYGALASHLVPASWRWRSGVPPSH